MKTKYDVFISYSRKDFENRKDSHVAKILQALQDADISFWYDQEGVEYGDDFVEKILEHIESAPIFVFLSSKNSNGTRFTCREVAIADELRKSIIPVKLDSTPYGEKIMFRIVDISPVRYDRNAERALKELIKRIRECLVAIKKEEQRQEEEKRHQLELEEAELLKEKNFRERKEQLARLREQHDQSKIAMDAAGKVVSECQSKLKEVKEALEVKESVLKEENSRLLELENLLKDNLQQKEDVYSDKEGTNDKIELQISKNNMLISSYSDINESDSEGKNDDKSIIDKNTSEQDNKNNEKRTEEDNKPLNSMLNNHKFLRKCLLGFIVIFCLFGLYKCGKQCSSKSDKQISLSDVSVDSMAKDDGRNSDLDKILDKALSKLSEIRPQLKEYIDGYKEHNAEATFKLAKCFEKGDFLEGNRNLEIAGKLYHIAADAGYANAQTSLGFYFFYGRGGYALNYDSAVYWYSEAIRNGSIDAKYYLALAYDDGRHKGTKQGERKTDTALELYKSSAESGFARSQVVLGVHYYANHKFLESKEWLEKALKSDSALTDTEKAKAEFYMGQLYGTGKLTIALKLKKEQVDQISFEWYKKAAVAGYTEAMYYLGKYYQNARGTKQDLVKAMEWFKKAAARNHQGAIDELSGKTKKSSPSKTKNKK